MRNLNLTVQEGNLTSDPELSYTNSQMPICKFNIANNRDYKDTKIVNYFEVVAWGKIAELCNQYLKKGRKVSIKGELRQQRWEDKTTGKKLSKIVINADEVYFLSQNNNNQSDNINSNDIPDPVHSDPGSGEDIPF